MAPVVGVGNVLGVILLEQAQVSDRLGDRALGLRDAVRVVPNHLVEHQTRVFSGVDQCVDVRLGQLGDPSEDRLLAHERVLSTLEVAGCWILVCPGF